MDILDRIVEAVAQKLISMRLNEENKKIDHAHSHKVDTGDKNAGKKSGSSNPGNKEARTRNTSKFHQDGFVPPEGTKQFSSKEAGASAPSIRTGSNRRLVSNVDPQRARTTPIKPEGGSAGGRGGQEEISSERATPPDKPKGRVRVLSRAEVVKRLSKK